MATFQCTVVTPERKLLEVDARYAAIPAWDGQMGIAPGRAPLMVQLGYGEMRIETEGEGTQRLFIAGGFAQMKGEVLSILADEAMPVDEIDTAEAQRELDAATGQTAPAGPAMDRRDHQAARARAMLAIQR